MELDFRTVIDGIDTPTNAVVVLDNLEAAEKFLKEVKEADLGLCVNMSTSLENAMACSCAAGDRDTVSPTRLDSRAKPRSCRTRRC